MTLGELRELLIELNYWESREEESVPEDKYWKEIQENLLRLRTMEIPEITP